ncbi:trypsin-like serine peptidase [Bacillus wiedmannii]|uniref:trypsin-like serine peptidase n=1 Tax=Bacillus wiedmannii TaxID=1890302 RepID=UPI00211ADF81|nr:trypsin-like serine protease [Bacillus wiedmannii]
MRILCDELDDINGNLGTGIVIGPHHVLTAAHVTQIQRACFAGTLIVYTGENGVGIVAKKHTAESVKIHPSYNSSADDRFAYDLAVLRTSEPFTQFYNEQIYMNPLHIVL